MAIKHGQIRVETNVEATQKGQIREIFLNALAAKNVSFRNDFVWKDLKNIIQAKPKEVAFAFIKCALTTRLEHGVIESAMAGGSNGKWRGKDLTKESVFGAAMEYFQEFRDKYHGTTVTDINETVKNLESVTPAEVEP